MPSNFIQTPRLDLTRDSAWTEHRGARRARRVRVGELDEAQPVRLAALQHRVGVPEHDAAVGDL